MRIAKYKSLRYGYISADEVTDFMEESDQYIRITEPVEVHFIDLPAGEVVPQEVAVLEKAKEKARVEYLKMINDLDTKISKLMAIEAPE